jgi:hypothetical protein
MFSNTACSDFWIYAYFVDSPTTQPVAIPEHFEYFAKCSATQPAVIPGYMHILLTRQQPNLLRFLNTCIFCQMFSNTACSAEL